jgi:uncharacterized protein (DUF58 family)
MREAAAVDPPAGAALEPAGPRAALVAGAALGAGFRLALVARQRGGRSGTRLGLGVGSSLEFEDYRDYQPGDDLRRLDWGVYARTDRLVMRTHREEVAPRVDLFVDVSRSMALPEAKAAATWRLAGILAAASAAAGLHVLAWRVGERAERLAPAGADPLAWGPLDLDAVVGPERGLGALPPLSRGGARLLVSDLLFPADPTAVLRWLVEGGCAAAVVQLAAASEVEPEAAGEVRLRDVESRAAVDIVVTPAVLAAYRQARSAHLALWEEACRRHRVELVEVRAEAIAGPEPAAALAGLIARGVLGVAPQG